MFDQQNQSQPQSAYNQDNVHADVDTTTHDPAVQTQSATSNSDDANLHKASVAIASNLELPESFKLPGNLSTPAPVTDATAAPAPVQTAPAAPAAPAEPAFTPPTPSSVPAPAAVAAPQAQANSDSELISIKQQALQQLSPIVSRLEQSPEERFRTTMMMIQATDDASKIKDAYSAAQQIADEKVRAQALLDVVNEINYFSQQHHS